MWSLSVIELMLMMLEVVEVGVARLAVCLVLTGGGGGV